MEQIIAVTYLGMIATMLAMGIFWVWQLVDCLKSDFKKQNDKMIWLIVLLLAGPLGALIYTFVGKRQKVDGSGDGLSVEAKSAE
ncbi:MAG: PLDc N-terminal domain-containing protein [Betaproteobacteria bacterium]|nr:PLDc N-terminal domain-containing protein [Betaproteobacteria bacterium]